MTIGVVSLLLALTFVGQGAAWTAPQIHSSCNLYRSVETMKRGRGDAV